MKRARAVEPMGRAASAAKGRWVVVWAPLLVGWLLGLVACGSEPGSKSENYGNVLASPGGLEVLEEEHPSGWMRPDCFHCHTVKNMHHVNRTGLPDDEADLAGVRAIIESGGEASCAMCHGSNGVAP